MDHRKNQKKQAQKDLLEKRRNATFIAEYVKRKAPETYAEAENFLKILRQRYPHKRDHTKTHEFLVDTTGYEDYMQYYNRTKLRRIKQNKTASTTSVDNMVLAIPLMPETVVAENTTAPLQPIPQETYEELITEITRDPALQVIFNDFVSNQDLENEPNDIELDESITGLSPLEKELLDYN